MPGIRTHAANVISIQAYTKAAEALRIVFIACCVGKSGADRNVVYSVVYDKEWIVKWVAGLATKGKGHKTDRKDKYFKGLGKGSLFKGTSKGKYFKGPGKSLKGGDAAKGDSKGKGHM